MLKRGLSKSETTIIIDLLLLRMPEVSDFKWDLMQSTLPWPLYDVPKAVKGLILG